MRSVVLIVFVCLLAFPKESSSQKGKLPPFQIVLSNGTIFKARQLPLGKPIVIIYFSPDCDHCEKLMKEVLKHKASLQKTSVAMVTHLPVQSVTGFAKKYQLNNESNFYVGTEGSTLFLKNYYKLTEMPFIALYTKNGDLVKIYRHEGSVDDLCSEVSKLQ